MTIEWKDSYRIGDENIDQQHLELFAIATEMLAAHGQDALRLCAMKLYRHVRNHFADEEALMFKVAYPQVWDHIQAHEKMLRRLHALSLAIGKNEIDPVAITNFVGQWALQHIPTDDAKLAQFITP